MGTAHLLDSHSMEALNKALGVATKEMSLEQLATYYDDLEQRIGAVLGPRRLGLLDTIKYYIQETVDDRWRDWILSSGMDAPDYQWSSSQFSAVAIHAIKSSRRSSPLSGDELYEVVRQWSKDHRLNHVYICPTFPLTTGLHSTSSHRAQVDTGDLLKRQQFYKESYFRDHLADAVNGVPSIGLRGNLRWEYPFMQFPSDPDGYHPEAELALAVVGHVHQDIRGYNNPRVPWLVPVIARYIARSVLSSAGYIAYNHRDRSENETLKLPIPGEAGGLAINNLRTLRTALTRGYGALCGNLRVTTEEMGILTKRGEFLDLVVT